VEGHPALPQLKNFHRIVDEMAWRVEHHIADAAAQDDAERHPQDEIVEILQADRRRSAPQRLRADQRAGIQPAEQYSDNIGERIPADRERADLDQHRIDHRKRKGEERHAG
jgi:hypothetical protein